MTPIRLGAVGYLNARPLVYGLEKQTDRFTLRMDVPSKCASLLHDGNIDLGVIPSIEYLHRPDYRIVPGVAITSKGAVASVALFTTRPTPAIRSIALDSSSRTSAALLRVLCAQWFDIEPKFITCPPDLGAMTKRCDAAMIIGDAALFADHEAAGLDKIDLGEEWTAMTGLPFVWAFWAGRSNAIGRDVVPVLQAARDAGVGAVDTIARTYWENDEDKIERSREYLRNNIQYALGEEECSGIRKFYDAASDLRIVPNGGTLRFY